MATTNKNFRIKNGLEVSNSIGVGTNGTSFGTSGQILSSNGTGSPAIWIDNYSTSIKHEVKLAESISKGQAVYVSSASGNNMLVSKASNASETTSSKTLGLIDASGTTNDFVNVITEGLITGTGSAPLDTSAANAEGDPVWLGTSGNLIYGLTNKPVAPAHLVFIGIVTRKSSTVGEIFVRVQNGFEVAELHNVLIGTGYSSTPNDNDLLAYDTASSLWKNQTASEAGLAALSGATFTGNIAGTNIAISGDMVSNTLSTNGSASVSGPLYVGLDTYGQPRVQMGQSLTSSTPTITFNSSGFGNDNDANITVTGGTNGVNSKATVTINSGLFDVQSNTNISGTLNISSNLTVQSGQYLNADLIKVTSLYNSSLNKVYNSTTNTFGDGLGGTYFVGNGSNLTAIPAANLTGTAANIVYTTTTSLPNVTSVNGTTIPGSATLLTTGSTLDASKLNTNTVVTLNATNVTATNVNATTALISGDANVAGKLSVTYQAGDEGGEIFLNKAATNTTITGGVTIDVYQNKIRFFEQGGSARGAFIDLANAAAGVGSNVLAGGSADGNTTYDISAVSTTGGSLLRLTSTSPSGTDDVKFANGDGISVAYTDASTITITPNIASATVNGIVTTGTQTFAGSKTFSSTITANVSGNVTGGTYNALSLTAATTGFTIAGGTTSKTLTVSNTIAIAGTDSSTLNIGSGGTLGTAAFTASSAYEPAITTLTTSKGGTGLSSFTSGGAVYATSTSALTTGTLPLTAGGTGATTAQSARSSLSAAKVFAQTSQPLDADSAVGDIWIDTDSTPPGNITVSRLDISKVSTNQNLSNTTWTLLTFPTSTENVGGFIYSSGNITIPTTGRYSLTTQVDWDNAGSAQRRILGLYVNGTRTWESRMSTDSQVGTIRQMMTIASERFSAGDVIGIWGEQNSGGTLGVSNARLVLEYLGA